MQILEFSKLSSASAGADTTVHLSSEPFGVAQLLTELAEIVGAKAIQKGVELMIEFDQAVSEGLLLGDAFRLRQCLVKCARLAYSLTRTGKRSPFRLRAAQARRDRSL